MIYLLHTYYENTFCELETAPGSQDMDEYLLHTYQPKRCICRTHIVAPWVCLYPIDEYFLHTYQPTNLCVCVSACLYLADTQSPGK